MGTLALLMTVVIVAPVIADFILSNTYETSVTLVDSTGSIIITEDTAFSGAEKFLGTDISGKIKLAQQDLDVPEFYVYVLLHSTGGALEVGDVTLDVDANIGATFYLGLTGEAFVLDGTDLLWKSPLDTAGFGGPLDLETCYYAFVFHTTSGVPEGDLDITIWTSDT